MIYFNDNGPIPIFKNSVNGNSAYIDSIDTSHQSFFKQN